MTLFQSARFSGEKVNIRSIGSADAEHLFNLLEGEDLSRAGIPHPVTPEVVAGVTRDWTQEIGPEPSHVFGVTLRTSGQLVGMVGLSNAESRQEDEEGSINKEELAILIGKEHRGQGLGLEAVQLATLFALEHLDAEEVFAEVDDWNLACARTLEAAAYGIDRASVDVDGVQVLTYTTVPSLGTFEADSSHVSFWT